MNALKQTYQNLPARDKKLVHIGFYAIIFFICYQFVYVPFQEKIAQLSKQQQFHQTLNGWFKEIQPKIRANQRLSPATTVQASQLISISSDSLKKSIISVPYELSQNSSNSIELNIKQVAYVEFIEWFEAFFEKTPGLNIKELNLTPLSSNGMITVFLKFETNEDET